MKLSVLMNCKSMLVAKGALIFVFKFFELTTSCPLPATLLNTTTSLTSNDTNHLAIFNLTTGYNFSNNSSDTFNNSHRPLPISNFFSWTSCPYGQLKLVPNDLRVGGKDYKLKNV